MFPGNDLAELLDKAMLDDSYQEAMGLVERLVHNYKYWRNSPMVIKYATVAYYETGHTSYAWNWSVIYLGAVRKDTEWGFDHRFLWKLKEFTTFIDKIAKIFEYQIPSDLTNKIKHIEEELKEEMAYDDFMWSRISPLNSRIDDIHAEMIAGFSSMLKDLNLKDLFNAMEVVSIFNGLKEDQEFSRYMNIELVSEASKYRKQCVDIPSFQSILNGYKSLLNLANANNFSSPMPDKMSYREYWNRISIIVLSDFMKSLYTKSKFLTSE